MGPISEVGLICDNFRLSRGRRDSGRALNFGLVSKTGHNEVYYRIEGLLTLG